MKKLLQVLVVTLFSFPGFAQTAFTTGNLVLVNVNSSNNASLLEYSTAGTLLQTVPIPATGAGALTVSFTATSEGALSRSQSGQFLGLVGYRTGTNGSLTDRVIGRVKSDGTINTSSAIPNAEGYTGNNIRAAVFSDDGSRFWTSGTGTGGGVRTNSFGAVSGSTQISTTITNTRAIHVFNGQLYISSATGTFQGISTVGTGLPTSSGQTITLLNGFPTASGPGSYGFSINAAGNVIYLADDRTTATGGGIQKWTLSGATWTLAYTMSSGLTAGVRSIAVDFTNSSTPTIYATTADASLNKLVKVTDNGASSAYSTIATAAANNIFRGVTFAPVAPAIPAVNLSVSSNSGSEAAATAITVTATASSPVSGDQTVNLAVTGTGITAGDYNLSNTTITIPNGSTAGSVTFTVIDDAAPEPTETAVLTISTPSAGITLGAPVSQNITITDNDNTAPTILLDVTATSDYIDAGALVSPNSPYSVSAVINDPTDPAFTSGLTFAIADNETAAASLLLTAGSSNQATVPNANIIISGTGASRNIKISPAAVGYSTITVTVSDGVSQTSYTINYAASGTSSVPASTRFHTGTSDASTAVAVDNNYMLVGDDENQVLRLYNRQNSGLPVNGFDYTSSLGLTDFSGGIPREVDIEASAAIGNRIYWLGSQSNAANGNARPNRYRLYATDLSGSGAAATLSYVGRYDNLRTDLLNWDAGNLHGLGANYFGLTASATIGVIPETADGSGFNIEGLTIAPDGSTGYISFRAPIQPTTNRTKALIVPVTNLAALVSGNPATGPAVFGAPIQLNLGGRGIREIKRNASGQYLVIAGPHDGATGVAPKDFRLYTWTGNPADLPVLRSANLTALNANGSFESIVDVPDPLNDTSPLQLLVDNGDADFYNDGTAAKDLAVNNFKKFRSDTVFLGAAVPQINTGNIVGAPFCNGSGTSVPYALSGTLNSGNVFTAELSDAAGSFASPVAIGTLNGNTNSGVIPAIIPMNAFTGSTYRVRVVASSPVTIGNDNGLNIALTGNTAILATTNQNITQDVADNSFEAGTCTGLVANVFPDGGSPVNGNVTAKVWIEGTQPTQFVKRHYEITPAVNAANASARITIYFTQSEFDDFNAVNAIKLPTGAADASGIANLLVEKRGGSSSNGSGLPDTYTGSVLTINPADVDIVWNTTAARWEISFDITGFSGFFVKTQAVVLPLQLVGFTATRQTLHNNIQWQTNNELNTRQFDLQWSNGNGSWTTFASVNATGSGNNHYRYDDSTHSQQRLVFYRLKMVDIDGTYKYSPVVKLLNGQNNQLIVFPSPAKDVITIFVSDNSLLQSLVYLYDANGRMLRRETLTKNLQQLSIENLAGGFYFLKFKNGEAARFVKQ